MGQSCVRDCERQAQELAGDDPALRGRSGGSPGFSGGPQVVVGGAFANPHLAVGSQGDLAAIGVIGVPANVPPVPNWFQALRRDAGADPGGQPPGSESGLGTTRTDDALASPGGLFGAASPQSAAGSSQWTSRSPRSGAPGSERSPRADELPKDTEISYEGEYLGAMKHGVGRLRMNGNTFEGEFRNDLKHGEGALTWDDGRQYRGRFEDGMFHGHATMSWPDGRKYCGQYSEDRKHGEGTFSWQDGRRYQGQWVAGKRHGVGVYTNAKGLTRTGTWQVDRPVQWAAPVEAVAISSRGTPAEVVGALLTDRSAAVSATGTMTERSGVGPWRTPRTASERLDLANAAGPPPPADDSGASAATAAPLVEGNKVSNL